MDVRDERVLRWQLRYVIPDFFVDLWLGRRQRDSEFTWVTSFFSFGCDGLVWLYERNGLMCRRRLETHDVAGFGAEIPEFFGYLLVEIGF